MKLGECITRVLERVGLTATSTEFQNQARHYINMMLAETVPLVQWWWLDRSTTFATVASTATYSPVSGNVTSWWSFTDETNNRTLGIIGPTQYDSWDPDQDTTGDPRSVFIAGQDATTGYPTVSLYPIPDGAYTIRVRYRADIDEWTSTNDNTDFLTLGIPRIMESVLLYGACSLYLERQGDDSGASREAGNLDRALKAARKQNLAMWGDRSPSTPDYGPLIILDSTLAIAS